MVVVLLIKSKVLGWNDNHFANYIMYPGVPCIVDSVPKAVDDDERLQPVPKCPRFRGGDGRPQS